MPENMDLFTVRAKLVLRTAEEQARYLEHSQVGPEHLLLGLVHETQGVTASFMRKLIDEDRLLSVIIAVSKIPKRSSDQQLELSDSAKQILELAVSEARRLSATYIGTEHLLLGLIRQNDGIINAILANFKLSLEDLNRQLGLAMQAAYSTTARGKWVQSKGIQEKYHSNTPLVDQLTDDLTEFALDGKLDPIAGREPELQRMIQVLSSRRKRNVLLIGQPGVGKTALVHALAHRISSGNVPEALQANRVLLLDAVSLVAGTTYQGQFEERLNRTILELQAATECILFIDDMADGLLKGRDRPGILLSFARATVPLIHAAATENFEKYLKPNSVVMNAFTPIFVKELSIDDTIKALQAQRRTYENYHHLVIDDDAIEAAARLSGLYIKDGFQPDKGIQVIDQAAAGLNAQLKPNQQMDEADPQADQEVVPRHLTKQDVMATLSQVTGLGTDQLNSTGDVDGT